MTLRELPPVEEEDGPLRLEPADRYDRCILGIATRFNSKFIVYSEPCILRVIAEDAAEDGDDDPMTAALEHFQFNIVGGWVGDVGDGTPAFLDHLEGLEDQVVPDLGAYVDIVDQLVQMRDELRRARNPDQAVFGGE